MYFILSCLDVKTKHQREYVCWMVDIGPQMPEMEYNYFYLNQLLSNYVFTFSLHFSPLQGKVKVKLSLCLTN
jgi:hypothetical protein